VRVCDESMGRNREKNMYERGRSGGKLTWCVMSMHRLGWRLDHWHCREVNGAFKLNCTAQCRFNLIP
jgi:hypothetical protein